LNTRTIGERLYAADAPSDSEWNRSYEVTLDTSDDSFVCECPAFRFGKDNHCKHIARVGPELRDFADKQEREDEVPTMVAGGEDILSREQVAAMLPLQPIVGRIDASHVQWSTLSSEPQQFDVSLNGGTPATLDRPTLNWLVESLAPGGTIEVTRVS
jgi:hypothetical protein